MSPFCHQVPEERMRFVVRAALLAWLLYSTFAAAADYPAPVEGDFILRDFRFSNGETLPELRMHYRTLGTPRKDKKGIVRNAVWIGHGTGGSGEQFLRPEFAGELFGAGQLLDATKYFIVLPDGIGHGKSAKPSDGLKARFPQYGYTDMVEAQYRLLNEGLQVNHLRLVMGTSMGGMHTWVWGERHPGVHGRTDAAREPADADLGPQSRLAQDADRRDSQRPRLERRQLHRAAALPAHRGFTRLLHGQQPDPAPGADADAREGRRSAGAVRCDRTENADANDVLYQVSASWDYDPGPGLEKIRAPLVAVNSADDIINPPELGILEREIKRVSRGAGRGDPAIRGHAWPRLAHDRSALEATPVETARRVSVRRRGLLISTRW